MGTNTFLTSPPMGWNSWNTFYDQVTEDLIISTADAMVDFELHKAGYEYIIIDDCWSARERDSEGHLQPDPDKFPHGMKAVSDYVHSKGLKLGIYSCCGVHTCAGYPGSFEHEFEDARQFAEWGIDYLKYDNCFHPATISSEGLYRRMNMALRSCGRDIVFAVCQWGRDDVHSWIRSTGAHTFRSTIDIQDSWKSIENIALSQLEKQSYIGAGCYNDMDILIVGMHGKGLNPELIAINQDPECRGCYKLPTYGSPDAFVLLKQLTGSEWSVGFFNFGDSTAHVELHFWDMGLPLLSGLGLHFHDCLTHEDLGVKTESYAEKVAAHGCRVYRVRLENA